MQTFTPALRVSQSVATILGADDSLESINTNELSPCAVVVVQRSNDDTGLPIPMIYILRKASVVSADPPDIVAPAQGGPGRWFPYP